MRNILGILGISVLISLGATSTQAAESTCTSKQPFHAGALVGVSRYVQYFVGLANGIFKQHCVDYIPAAARNVPAMVEQFTDGSTDATITFEAAIAVAKDASEGRWDGEIPVLLGAFSGDFFVVVGSAPIGELVGTVIPTERCPDVDENLGWRDITLPENETYVEESPSINTMMVIANLRAAIGNQLPANTRIVCGSGLLDRAKPDLDGAPVVWITSGYKSTVRAELMVERNAGKPCANEEDGKDKVCATSLWLENYYNLAERISDLRIYDDNLGTQNIPAGGIYAFPSKVAERPEVFCNVRNAFADINRILLAGTISASGAGRLQTAANFDDVAEGAYGEFLEGVTEPEYANLIGDSTTIMNVDMNVDSPGVDEVKTDKVRRDLFARLRSGVFRSEMDVDAESLERFMALFGITTPIKYVNPCDQVN